MVQGLGFEPAAKRVLEVLLSPADFPSPDAKGFWDLGL